MNLMRLFEDVGEQAKELFQEVKAVGIEMFEEGIDVLAGNLEDRKGKGFARQETEGKIIGVMKDTLQHYVDRDPALKDSITLRRIQQKLNLLDLLHKRNFADSSKLFWAKSSENSHDSSMQALVNANDHQAERLAIEIKGMKESLLGLN